MSRGAWFLPDTPDVVGVLRRQVALTVEGMDAFADWAAAGGDAEASAVVHAREHEADTVKAELREALHTAFVTPLDPEDLYSLSRGIDWILNHAKDAIAESEVMACPPDEATARMAVLLAESVREIDAGVALIAGRSGDAAVPADKAVKGRAPAREGLPRRDGRARRGRGPARRHGPPRALSAPVADGRSRRRRRRAADLRGPQGELTAHRDRVRVAGCRRARAPPELDRGARKGPDGP
jgi:hypothetical protein